MSSYLRDRLIEWWRSLDHGQQVSLSFFAPCAALTLILAIVSLQSSIMMPFRAPKTLLKQSQDLLVRQRAEAELSQQSDGSKDTDGDGILDQDELRVFRTSPYLADTDSDGVQDGEEIRLGSDPNCPPDRDCYGFAETGADAVPVTGSAEAGTTTTVQGGGIEPPKPPESLSPTEIRTYLTRTGLATPEQLGALPDTGVVELYRRAYTELRQVNAAQTAPSPSVDSQSSPSTSP